MSGRPFPPRQGGEIVIRLPVLDPAVPRTPRDRVTEAEVDALVRHLAKRSKRPRPPQPEEMLVALIEVTARFMASLVNAGGKLPEYEEGFRLLADNMVTRAKAIVDGEPFGEQAAAVEQPQGSSTVVAELIDLLPPVSEEGDMGVLAHNVAGAMALKGLEVFQMETRGLSDNEKNGALIIAAAESIVVTALCASNPERAAEVIEFILERAKARAEQAIEARKAKMS